jgi:cobaltochelatase CobN
MATVLVFAGGIRAENLSLLVIDGDSYLAHRAVSTLDLPDRVHVRSFTHEDLKSDPQAMEFVASSKAIVVDVMMPELSQFVIDHHLTENRRVYALRGSRDDEDLMKRGFVFDRELRVYFEHLSQDNLRNLIHRVAHLTIDPAISFEPVRRRASLGIYHPEAPEVFDSYDAYLKWFSQRPGFDSGAPWIGLMFFASSIIEGQVESINPIISALERAGFNVLPCFGTDQEVLSRLLPDERRHPRVDLVVSFSLKFYSAINDKVKACLADLGVPVLNAINLYSIAIDLWRADPVGIPPLDVAWTIATPEISGVIEPTPLTGKVAAEGAKAGGRVYVYRSIHECLEHLIPRLKKWVALKRKPNQEKRVAILYYNHSQGKQNIGASYLNVFRSLDEILHRMRREGYRIAPGAELSEKAIQDMVLRTGLNIGSWAPGELERMLAEGKIVKIPVAEYRKWFDSLPQGFRDAVIKQWGPVESSDIMMRDGYIIIPAVVMGNVVLLPEPARGWSDAPMKLYHDITFYPHHQYVAAYLWLNHGFQTDAMIHLGTHATHEWLPGKQAGLSPSCPPEVLITDIPNLYPYIVDNVGEGIQAKRRGRAVIIDHLTPPLKRAGAYQEYEQLDRTIQQYVKARSIGGQTAQVHLEEIRDLVARTGLDRDLAIKALDEEAVGKIDHYLQEIKENLLPYGLHTFGRSPSAEALEETVAAISERNPRLEPKSVRENLGLCGSREMDHLVAALSARYVPPGEGNDPVRNPETLPTGRNFFGFSPDRIPSPAAWQLGKRAAEDILRKGMEENHRYPEKVAVVLWATETLRNEGMNECTILYLMGMEPAWDKAGRVTGTRVIPAPELKRPRIDVLINPSSLYRDLFPDKLLFLDKAVQQAAAQTDIENLIAKHTRSIKDRLRESGLGEDRAEELSRIRIFTEAPGAYGNRVSELASASGFWKKDDEIAEVYEKHTGFAYGQGKWGEAAQQVFSENLRETDAAVHSISSNIYGTLDNDDQFAYLGGLSLAIRKASGNTPSTMITLQRQPNELQVEDVARTIGREMRTRYLNPKWIQGMKAENYAGAREMAHFVEYLWGWQVTVPTSVDRTRWEEVFEVYVEDKYGQELKAFFNRSNPWAFQSLTARMLEAVRKEYWDADGKVIQRLASEYALNVVEKGVACCDHTCNNPMLNQMVVSIISLPGLLSPEIVEQFKLVVEKAAGRKLEEQVQARTRLQDVLDQGFRRPDDSPPPVDPGKDAKTREKSLEDAGSAERAVEGYRMKEVQKEEERTRMSSSGVQWFASLFILLLIALFVAGTCRGRKRHRPLCCLAAILFVILLTRSPSQAQHSSGHGQNAPLVMDAITVTAERISEYVKNHPQEVTVIERGEILKRNLLNMEEALQAMPGVDVRTSAGMGSRISIRGSGKSGGVLVLLNGRPLNAGQYGGVELSTIPIDIVRSITVFKPPVPVWLGPGATEGAIYIATHDFAGASDAGKKGQTRVKTSAGSYGLAEAGISHLLQGPEGSTLLSAGANHRDGKRANSDKDSGNLTLHWDRETQESGRFEIDGRYYGSEYGAPGPTDNPTPRARQRYQSGSMDTRLKGLVGESGDYSVQAYGDLVSLRDRSQSGFISTLDEVRFGMKGENNWSQEEGLWALRLGGILERDAVDHTLTGEHHRMSSGLSAQCDGHLDPFSSTLGIRMDHTNDFGFNPGFTSGLSYALWEKALAKAHAGYSVKVPTFGQLYQPTHGSIDQVRGNRDLEEERVWNYDIGLEHRFGKERVLQATLLRAETRDLIAFSRGSDLIYRPVNLDNAFRHGMEITLKYQMEMGLGADLSCIMQDSENRETGKELPYTPGRRLKATLKYTVPDPGTRLEATFRYEGKQFSEIENRESQRLDDYMTVDVKAIQPFSVKGIAAEWFIRVDNLFDTDFEVHYGYPDDGIRFVTGINLSF